MECTMCSLKGIGFNMKILQYAGRKFMKGVDEY